MKRVLAGILVAALWAGAAAQSETGREEDGLLGAVRTVRHEAAESVPGAGGLVRRVPLRAATYDARGNRVEGAEYAPDGSVSQRVVYTFDARGRATGYEEYAGAMTSPRKHIYVTDADGRRAEYRIVQPDGSPGEKYLYKYGADGRLAEEAMHDHKGGLISRNVYAYDERGRQVSQTRYNADGSVSSVARTSYDPQGRPAERVRHEGDVLTYRIKYAYDSGGRVVEQETVGSVLGPDVPPSEARAPGRVRYVYKDAGRPKEANAYAPDGSLRERVVFEYDSRGNWTKKTYFPPPAAGGRVKPRLTEYRIINYF
jgi:hypothetical protein